MEVFSALWRWPTAQGSLPPLQFLPEIQRLRPAALNDVPGIEKIERAFTQTFANEVDDVLKGQRRWWMSSCTPPPMRLGKTHP